jgi:CheY-like chemotaxis protein
MLDELGFVVEQANTAQESIDQARASAPELIMMDIRMPGMDGLEAIRVLKADGALAHVPIIAVIGHHLDNQARAIEAGAQPSCPSRSTGPR